MRVQLFLLFVLSGMHVGAQSTINFQNRMPGPPANLDFKIGFEGSTGNFIGFLNGSGWSAQIWAGTSEENLLPGFPITTFRTGAAAGYVNPVWVTIPGSAFGIPVYAQIRAWSNNHGQVLSWAEAMSDPTIARGWSVIDCGGISATHQP
jgi:hypothetical protein